MMSSAICALVAAVTVAFPKPGMKLPAIERCYVIGATEAGVTNVTVAGRDVAVWRTGAWATMVDVHEGSNAVEVVSADGSRTNRSFFVAKLVPTATNAPAKPPKKYEKLSYAAEAPATRPADRKAPLVFVDAGHGGKTDLGALSPHGWCEKEANLLLARAVADELARRGVRVRLVRWDDRAVQLLERARTAHEEKADAFVSIHHNAPPANGDAANVRYAGVYCWNDLGEPLAKAIAEKMDAVQKPELPSKGALRANFAVTRSPEIPSCLVEADFITHPAGEEAAWDPAKRARLAAAIAEGIVFAIPKF